MFLDKKTLLKIWLKLNQLSRSWARFITKRPAVLITKYRNPCYKMRRYQRMCFLLPYHGVFSFFATLIGYFSDSLRDAKVVKDIRPPFIKAIITGNFKEIIDSKKRSQALIPRYSNNKVSARGTTALTKKTQQQQQRFFFSKLQWSFPVHHG